MQTANVTIPATTDKLQWNAINWLKANDVVNNLRRRIYRASEAGDLKKVRNLQKLMMRSKANKLLAIRRVTQVNQGRGTPGVDKIVVETDKQRCWLLNQLSNWENPQSQPIRRVYIPKKNGKRRPLGIPTILDRCRQAVVKSALEPYWEAKFERISYGFRPGRGAHDAIQKIYCIVRAGKSRHWVLDADIKNAFNEIDHDYLLNTLKGFPVIKWIKTWLKSGVMEGSKLEPTTMGTAQGSIISPLLANIALHGMEEALGITYNAYDITDCKSEYMMVRYADDYVVFARSKLACIKAKEILSQWLSRRGLETSEEKTRIRHLTEGFDFLGFNIRHYETQSKKKGVVALIKPSHDSIKTFKKKMVIEWKEGIGWPTERVIENLNPKIRGWVNYFKIGVSKKIFNTLDDWMFKRQKRFVLRRHPNKHWWWLKPKYWGKINGRNDQWVFKHDVGKTRKFLWKLAWTPIERHVLVKGSASPDNPKLLTYWQNRQAKGVKFMSRRHKTLWRKQKGKCPICLANIDNGETFHLHHKTPKSLGGTDQFDNLALLHANCHRQIHSKLGQQFNRCKQSA